MLFWKQHWIWTSFRKNLYRKAGHPYVRSLNKVFDEVEIGCNVVVPIPNVDRGKGDPKNIMAMVQIKSEKGYRLATKQGILLGSYTRNQFEPTDFTAIKKERKKNPH